MTGFVLDASVTMRWILESDRARDQQYAWRVLERLDEVEAIVPSLWYLEVSNVLLGAEREHRIHAIESERFIEQLEALTIRADTRTSTQAFSRTVAVARSCNLTSYDAAYLELSMRTGLPISSLDHHLRRAAGRLDIPVFLA
jgi:predicted nucleic acid-binding protein|tara:strand:- start:795 stop:1220 length:426 start_codon:yes stop_codon:yes gene_type:complete